MENFNTKRKILIVEDDLLALRVSAMLLSQFGTIISANTEEKAIDLLNTHKFDIAFFDLNLSGRLEGLNLIKIATRKNIYSVIISGEDDPEIMEQALLNGGKDYLLKPFDKDKLATVFDRYLFEQNSLKVEEIIQNKYITSSPKLLKNLSILQNLSLSEKPVFIQGESGTGKEVIAHIIKDLLKNDNFVEVNCSSFNDNLIKSELFGHKKGSFTGADSNKTGLLKHADNGIIFLDEIHALSLDAQKMLLKAVEEKYFYPVGSETPIKSNFRIIAATCENINDLISRGEFRNDLFGRISTFRIDLIPLRERPDDIELLFKHFASKYNFQIVITKEAIQFLKEYSWPRNTREIQDLIENWVVNGHRLISPSILPNYIKHNIVESKGLVPSAHIDLVIEHGLSQFLAIYKKHLIQEVMARKDNIITDTAKALKMNRVAITQFLRNNKDLRI